MNHSKVLATLIICAAIIGSVFIVLTHGSEKNTQLQPPKTENLIGNIDTSTDIDTDKDGLKDWEEGLISTDPKNPDTDGDGTPDGAEVSASRDPRKAGPNDKITTNSTNETSSTNSEDNTLTGQVSRDFFSQYLLAKKGGVEITPDVALQIAQSVMQNIKTDEVTTKEYAVKDIIMIPDTEESKTNYVNTFIGILKKYPPKSNTNELDIILVALESQKESDIQKLDPIILAYKKILAETLKIPVPKSVVPDHMIYLNALYAVHKDISEMREMINDPIRGYIAYAHYQKNVLLLKIGFEGIQSHF